MSRGSRRPHDEMPRAYRGTKFYNYVSALPLEEIRAILLQKGSLERNERDQNTRQIKSVKSKISNLEIVDGVGLFGTIFYQIQKPTGDGRHYWQIKTLDFLICREPSVLILHGSRSLMYYVKEELERAIYSLNEDEPNRDPYFIPNSFDTADGKYIIKKIVKRMEAQNSRNILYEPQFKKLRENLRERGGQSFYRRDGTSALLDDEFCYLFELCGYWEPDLVIYSCGGITCPQVTEPIHTTINSDFSFSFSHNIPKSSLDTFWNSIILPIIKENDYTAERTECVENARAYLERIQSSR